MPSHSIAYSIRGIHSIFDIPSLLQFVGKLFTSSVVCAISREKPAIDSDLS